MKRLVKAAAAALTIVLTLSALPATARAGAAPDSVELVRLLNEFLAGAAKNDAGTHERFWADDLVYTGSSGRRIGKADIMKDVHDAPPAKPGEPETEYGAEAVHVREYGATAVVTFQLVATTKEKGGSQVARYFNSGTFVKRAGRWQAVCWQATRVVPSDEESHREVAMVETALRQALRVGEVSAIEALTEPSFVWTRTSGAALTRAQLVAAARAGVHQVVPSADSVAIAAYGETAIARGVAGWHPGGLQPPRSAADAPDFDVTSVTTLLYRGGAWRAVSLETTGEERPPAR